jgi:hypothetical protein
VLVELFTSEACSSCPPADALLIQLEKQPIAGVEVIALAEHVDYWNHLGWTDALSSPLFSFRQQQYATRFSEETVYTPQMVMNGRVQAPGGEREKVLYAIEQAARGPRANVSVQAHAAEAADGPDAVRIRISVERLPPELKSQSFDLILAMAETGVNSRVTSGENAGRMLRHPAVARSLTKVATLNSGQERFRGYSATLMTQIAGSWNRSQVRAVAFVQSRETQAVAGANWCSL